MGECNYSPVKPNPSKNKEICVNPKGGPFPFSHGARNHTYAAY